MKLEGVKVVLLDIEGTVCPISFVKEVLFPYTIQTLPNVIEQKWDSQEFRPYRAAFPEEVRHDPSTFQRHVRECTETDVKVSYLKNLQGYLWQNLYMSGVIKAPLYPDVLPSMRAWHHQSISIAIYSSGSIFAQKLFFQYTDTSEGNLDYLIVEYFDTVSAGPKTEHRSYRAIADSLQVPLAGILFLSDNVKEVAAARYAGMESVIVAREGNAPLSDEEIRDHTIVKSFDELQL